MSVVYSDVTDDATRVIGTSLVRAGSVATLGWLGDTRLCDKQADAAGVPIPIGAPVPR
jgi:hypothetical protein